VKNKRKAAHPKMRGKIIRTPNFRLREGFDLLNADESFEKHKSSTDWQDSILFRQGKFIEPE